MEQIRKNIIGITKKLIKIPSVGDNPKELIRVIDLVKQYFKKSTVTIKEYNFNQKPSIVISFHHQKSFDILLLGHLDVVAANTDSFNPFIKNGRIYGRGSADMKGAAAAMIELMKYFSKKERKISVGLILTTDEELGGKNGAKKIISLGYRAKVIMVPDGGNSLQKIPVETRGIVQISISLNGKERPPSSLKRMENPIEKLMSVYFRFKKELLKNREDLLINLGRIQGGEALNKVSRECKIDFEVRFRHPYKSASVYKLMKKHFRGRNIIKNVMIEADPIMISKNNTFLVRYKKIAQDVLKKKVIFGKQNGSHDGRYFAYKGIPIITTRPNSGGMHSDCEYVDINALYNLFVIYKKFID